MDLPTVEEQLSDARAEIQRLTRILESSFQDFKELAHAYGDLRRRYDERMGEPGEVRERQRPATCLHGHPWNEENTYQNPFSKKRRCRACGRDWARRHRAKAKARGAA